MKNETMTTDEVALLLRVHPNTVRALADAGELPGFKVGNQWRFRHADIQRKMQPAAKVAV